ncbi:uncharacterized protein LOC130141004 [Syzygium oleosum]|uniref:uncharacterized protein LOC130141004 n=1 Tax=Syzygium oleosum TaxID=219896 RepID=UPI0024BA7B37|nr:uncharacterized protein LOC130141004 [Syzygium oleosum]
MASNGATLRQRSELLLKAEKDLKKVKSSPKASEDEKKYIADQKTTAQDDLNDIVDSIKDEEVLVLNTMEEVKAFIGLHSTYFAEGKRGSLKKVEIGSVGSVGSNDTKRKMWAILESAGFKVSNPSLTFTFP